MLCECVLYGNEVAAGVVLGGVIFGEEGAFEVRMMGEKWGMAGDEWRWVVEDQEWLGNETVRVVMDGE